jgi:hypothetical protein
MGTGEWNGMLVALLMHDWWLSMDRDGVAKRNYSHV